MDEGVDLQHQLAYAFRQAFRFYEQGRVKQFNETNEQIKQILTVKKSPYLQVREEETIPMDEEPILIFYSLYFSVFYKNQVSLTFLTDYIRTSNFMEEADKLL